MFFASVFSFLRVIGFPLALASNIDIIIPQAEVVYPISIRLDNDITTAISGDTPYNELYRYARVISVNPNPPSIETGRSVTSPATVCISINERNGICTPNDRAII